VTVKPWDKSIALTFDDGPDPGVTPTVLDALVDKGVHASFFSVGAGADLNQEITLRAFNEGHDIANHSKHHRIANYHNQSGNPGSDLLYRLYKDELIYTQNIIEEVTGKAPVFFRSPGLCENPSLLQVAAELGLPDIFCQDTNDYQEGGGMTPDIILSNAQGAAMPWGILLFHDYYGGAPMEDEWVGNGVNTKNAIPLVIDWLWSQGYEVISVSEMLAKRKALYLTPGVIYKEFTNVPENPAFPANGVITPVSGVSVSASNVSIEVGETRTITATLTPVNATRKTVYWYSADDRIADVNSGGLISAKAPGTTVVYVRAEGETAKVDVTVTGPKPDPLTSWTVFDFAGNGFENNPSGAIGEVGSYTLGNMTYSNALKLELPNKGAGQTAGSMAMTYQIPFTGAYRFSVWAWVEKGEAETVLLSWEMNSGDWQLAGSYSEPVSKFGEWVELRSDSIYLEAETSWIYLLAYNGDGAGKLGGLKDATVYFRDLKLELEGMDVTIIDIPSTAVGTSNKSITLQWADNGDLIEADAVTVKKDGTVTITAPPGLQIYEWHVGKEIFSGTAETHRSFVFDSTNRAVGTYSIGFYSGIDGGDAVKITITNN